MDVNINLSVFYVLFCFLLIFFVARKILFLKLERIIDERSEKIEGNRRSAASDEETIEQKTAEIKKVLDGARSEAFAERHQLRDEALDRQKAILEETRKSNAEKLKQAEGEIAATVEEAKVTIRTESDEMAKKIAANILGRTA